MDLKALGRDFEQTYFRLADITNDYQNMALNPKVEPEVQITAVVHYTERVLVYLALIDEINKYYRSRPAIEKSILENMLKVSDKVEELIHQQSFDKLLEEIDDSGGKIIGNELSNHNISKVTRNRQRTRKSPDVD